MFDLKPIPQASITGALSKAERYRLFNEPTEAESICRDILEVEPDNRQALISLTLALTDQIPQDAGAFANALGTIARLETPYDRAYHAGIAWERRAKAHFHGPAPGSHRYAYEWIMTALRLFEERERIRPPGNAGAIL